ncbi:outer membrane lipoprotein chaperone LolA [Legionella sp. km772]|uniref:outer membrane lipoprotein chaperone LolA n=1 Tax=Legionella sp. km772 TaxID=2498111 RepID=UPI000F8E975D|nr:outer membrane lipoprotein chaperone LolA [Legionella sp. km772]RUR13078.1 outer membrane lipoprotein carrier protein LolA [Legionella sp. km772]
MKKLALLLSLCCYSAFAFSESPGEVLQNKLNALSTMSADFKQTVKAKQKTVSRSSGTMALQRPGRFRWKTVDPMEQLIVADGQKMWIYDIELEQVTVKKQERGLGGTAALFLSGYDNQVAKDFDVSEKNDGKKTVFDLKAKAAKENFQRIKLIFNKEQLVGLELYDQLGQITYVTLSQIKSNDKLSAKLFQFTPPKGVDVVKQ